MGRHRAGVGRSLQEAVSGHSSWITTTMSTGKPLQLSAALQLVRNVLQNSVVWKLYRGSHHKGHKALIYVLEHSFYMRISTKKKKDIHLHTNKNTVLKCYAPQSTRLKLLINKAFRRSQRSEQTVLWPTIHRGYVLTADPPQTNLDFILLRWQMNCTHNLI